MTSSFCQAEQWHSAQPKRVPTIRLKTIFEKPHAAANAADEDATEEVPAVNSATEKRSLDELAGETEDDMIKDMQQVVPTHNIRRRTPSAVSGIEGYGQERKLALSSRFC